MKWLKVLWRDLVAYVKWGASVDNEPIVKEFKKVCDMATKYELLQKHFPNILALLNEAVEKKGQE